MDRELVRLTRGYARERLEFGRVLDRLGLRFRELGFRRFDLYVRERASQSPGWCAHTRALASRLEERPAIRAALLSGRIGWSLAELLARHSTREDESELLESTRGMTVREVRDALRRRSETVDDDEFVTIDLPGSPEELLALEGTRVAIEHLNGGAGEPGLWLECLLFEGTSTLLDLHPDLVPDLGEEMDGMVAERRRRREEEECAQRRAKRWRRPVEPFEPFELERIDTCDPVELDRVVRERAATLASRNVWLGTLLAKFLAVRGWRRLGYASEQHYFDERLGMARSTARSRVTLVQRMRWLEGLSDAIRSGELGYEQASLVARVASKDTLGAWIERARGRTYEHLREEVAAAELLARANDTPPRALAPPTDEELEEVQNFERDVLSGETMTRALMNPDALRDEDGEGHEQGEGRGQDDPEERSVQMSAGFRPGRRGSMRVRVREEVACHYRRLEGAFRESRPPGSFVFFLTVAFWKAWGPSFLVGGRWKAVHDRDRHRCMSPVCNSRNTTCHHIRYRAHGGGDELENLITLCEFCHLEGEHGGRLSVGGSASSPSWTIGRPPVLRVEGREKQLL